MRLSILPVGDVGEEVLSEITADLSQAGLEAEVAPGRGIPAGAYNRRRRQYRATAFIQLARRVDGDHILAVTDVDIYADPLNFVFGQAEVGGRVAVISLHRLRSGGPHLLRERALKEALHELGHNQGLSHCPDHRCVMFFSNNLADTDWKGSQLCSECQGKLAASPG